MAGSGVKTRRPRSTRTPGLRRFRLRLQNGAAVEIAARSKEHARALAAELLGPAVKRRAYRFPVRTVYELKAPASRHDPGIEDVRELRALMLDIFRRYRDPPEFGSASHSRKQVMTFTPRPLRKKGPFGQRARYR